MPKRDIQTYIADRYMRTELEKDDAELSEPDSDVNNTLYQEYWQDIPKRAGRATSVAGRQQSQSVARSRPGADTMTMGSTLDGGFQQNNGKPDGSRNAFMERRGTTTLPSITARSVQH